MATTIEAVNEKLNALDKRVDKIEKDHEAINKIATSVQLIAQKQDDIAKDVASLTGKVDCLEKKPGQNWEKLVWIVIAAIVGGFIGYYI